MLTVLPSGCDSKVTVLMSEAGGGGDVFVVGAGEELEQGGVAGLRFGGVHDGEQLVARGSGGLGHGFHCAEHGLDARVDAAVFGELAHGGRPFGLCGRASWSGYQAGPAGRGLLGAGLHCGGGGDGPLAVATGDEGEFAGGRAADAHLDGDVDGGGAGLDSAGCRLRPPGARRRRL